MTEKNNYSPDYAIHPGELLRDELAEMSKEKVLAIPRNLADVFFLLMTEKYKVYGLEKELAELTGTSEELWSNLQKNYDEWEERQSEISAEYCEIAERRVRETHVQLKLLTA